MQELLSRYACYWNQRHGHTGHLFRNRFYSKRVSGEAQFLNTACYIDLNPVAARLRQRPDQWRWSSYRAHAGLGHPPRFLANAEFLKLVGATPEKAKAAYRRYVFETRKAVSDTGFERSEVRANT
jgi:hypothetical protein